MALLPFKVTALPSSEQLSPRFEEDPAGVSAPDLKRVFPC